MYKKYRYDFERSRNESSGFFFDANYVIDKRNERVYDNKEFMFTKEVDYEGCNLR